MSCIVVPHLPRSILHIGFILRGCFRRILTFGCSCLGFSHKFVEPRCCKLVSRVFSEKTINVGTEIASTLKA
ncbi:hypothetical protein Hdeb2414_s0032g00713091 [Helianthus debilis subsp. tardiflorus]